MGVRRGVRRVPLREAAQLLGVSKDAVRQRIRRGTIRSEKGENGRVYVFVDTSSDDVHEHGRGQRDATAVDLVDELRDQVRYLRNQLDQEREANSENRRIIAALTSRIPELPAASEQASSSEARESPEMADDEQQGRGPVPDAGGPQEGAESPWWRRVFGG